MDKRKVLRKITIILFWLLLWQLIALWVNNDILFTTPVDAFGRLLELIFTGEFWVTVAGSLIRIGAGFGFGLVSGLILAVVSSKCTFFEELISPLVTLCKTIPVASFVVLLLIWWGSENLAISICFLIVLPNIYLGTLAGIRNTDHKLLEMAEVFALPGQTRFFYIYRPALRPFLSSNLKLALGMCWKSGVAAEVIGTPMRSIGEQLYFSKIHLDTAGVFAWTTVIILLSIMFEKMILLGTDCFFEWKPHCPPAGCGRNAGYIKRRIRVSHLQKTYGQQKVFENYNAVYEPGEVYYLTDPSGSGKTTLLRMLAGLEKPNGGTIDFEGGKTSISMMFQENRLCEEYSAVKNIEMITGSVEEAEKALLQLLEPDALNKPCSQLSGGMKRRVALVRAMEACGGLVLLDEPYTGMDAVTRERAERYIRNRQVGRIIIMATHIFEGKY